MAWQCHRQPGSDLISANAVNLDQILLDGPLVQQQRASCWPREPRPPNYHASRPRWSRRSWRIWTSPIGLRSSWPRRLAPSWSRRLSSCWPRRFSPCWPRLLVPCWTCLLSSRRFLPSRSEWGLGCSRRPEGLHHLDGVLDDNVDRHTLPTVCFPKFVPELFQHVLITMLGTSRTALPSLLRLSLRSSLSRPRYGPLNRALGTRSLLRPHLATHGDQCLSTLSLPAHGQPMRSRPMLSTRSACQQPQRSTSQSQSLQLRILCGSVERLPLFGHQALQTTLLQVPAPLSPLHHGEARPAPTRLRHGAPQLRLSTTQLSPRSRRRRLHGASLPSLLPHPARSTSTRRSRSLHP